MNLHTDTETLDRWRTTGAWVMFGEGDKDPCDHKYFSCGDIGCMGPVVPPDWMVEAAKPCETCGGLGCTCVKFCERADDHICPDCDKGRQRYTITVPCETCGGNVWVVKPHQSRQGGPMLVTKPCTDCNDGRITVPELAVVEWGPLVVVDWHSIQPWQPRVSIQDDGRMLLHRSADDLTVDLGYPLPLDIDPQSLVGQYAIGGKLVTQ